TSLRCAQDAKESAHFNKRHHRFLHAEAFGLEFVGCAGRSDIVWTADQHTYFGKWLRDNKTVPASEPPTARIFEIHWQHQRTGFLCEKDDAWPKFVSRATWAVGCDDDVASGRKRFSKLKDCARAQTRTGAANHIVAKTVNGIREQIAIAAGAD